MDRSFFREHASGPVVSINTPFTREGEVDFGGIRSFVDRVIDAGSKTVLLTPGDSLYVVLGDDEVAEITRVVAEHVAGRAMFIAAADSWWTGKTVEYARHARKVGADATIVRPPIRGTTPDDLVRYYAAVSAELPVWVLSGSLSALGVSGAVECVKRLRDEVSGVVGLKEDYCPQFARRACLEVYGRWAVFSGGQKQTHMDMLPYGCDGYMSIFMVFKPEVSHAYWAAVESEDLKAATAIIRDFDMPMFHHLYTRYAAGGDAGQHALMEIAGISGRWRRDPLPDLSDDEVEELAGFLDGLPES